ncbi:general stress protein [Brevibacillus fulvus]|uniref:Holliday junction resolvasome RuvABC DNA-binding subunit n=1 Tax=Brevibacillus fulvus TaxID=1125967 RepID=A0A939BSH2_9BACL|nr:general stress protein [Brevibacillus fulvus]MBM7590463.1 Holliday junction resolvasome RuvABC DNA-binding subunit [Brevibacillus fulvus]
MISATKPFVKFHKYDQALVADVQALNSSGYAKDDIHVLRYNAERYHPNRQDEHYKYKTKMEEVIGDIDSKAHFFQHSGKEFRTKLEHLGFTEDEAESLFNELQETDYTCLLVVRNLRDDIIDLNSPPQ